MTESVVLFHHSKLSKSGSAFAGLSEALIVVVFRMRYVVGEY